MDVMKLEMVQLESHTEKLISKLGSEVYAMLMDKHASVSGATPALRGILKGIEGLLVQNELKKKKFLSAFGWLALAVAIVERP
jgi:hypothetical protein